jgi:hypothetical protein
LLKKPVTLGLAENPIGAILTRDSLCQGGSEPVLSVWTAKFDGFEPKSTKATCQHMPEFQHDSQMASLDVPFAPPSVLLVANKIACSATSR